MIQSLAPTLLCFYDPLLAAKKKKFFVSMIFELDFNNLLVWFCNTHHSSFRNPLLAGEKKACSKMKIETSCAFSIGSNELIWELNRVKEGPHFHNRYIIIWAILAELHQRKIKPDQIGSINIRTLSFFSLSMVQFMYIRCHATYSIRKRSTLEVYKEAISQIPWWQCAGHPWWRLG